MQRLIVEPKIIILIKSIFFELKSALFVKQRVFAPPPRPGTRM